MVTLGNESVGGPGEGPKLGLQALSPLRRASHASYRYFCSCKWYQEALVRVMCNYAQGPGLKAMSSADQRLTGVWLWAFADLLLFDQISSFGVSRVPTCAGPAGFTGWVNPPDQHLGVAQQCKKPSPHMHELRHTEAHDAISSLQFVCGIPFNVGLHPAWHEMWDAVHVLAEGGA